MSCPCGYADECDDGWAIFYPLGNGGSVAVRPCPNQKALALWEKEYYEEESQYFGTD